MQQPVAAAGQACARASPCPAPGLWSVESDSSITPLMQAAAAPSPGWMSLHSDLNTSLHLPAARQAARLTIRGKVRDGAARADRRAAGRGQEGRLGGARRGGQEGGCWGQAWQPTRAGAAAQVWSPQRAGRATGWRKGWQEAWRAGWQRTSVHVNVIDPIFQLGLGRRLHLLALDGRFGRGGRGCWLLRLRSCLLCPQADTAQQRR